MAIPASKRVRAQCKVRRQHVYVRMNVSAPTHWLRTWAHALYTHVFMLVREEEASEACKCVITNSRARTRVRTHARTLARMHTAASLRLALRLFSSAYARNADANADCVRQRRLRTSTPTAYANADCVRDADINNVAREEKASGITHPGSWPQYNSLYFFPVALELISPGRPDIPKSIMRTAFVVVSFLLRLHCIQAAVMAV